MVLENSSELTHFKIVVPMYNVENWIMRTISSIKEQTYYNFQCILVDDFSTDATTTNALKAINGDKRFQMITNQNRKFAAENRYNGIMKTDALDEDIIVMIDGDDWFAKPTALKTIYEKYEEKKCWMTYGTYLEYPTGVKGKFAFQYPNEVVDTNSFRKFAWGASQPRTFKYWLWKKVKKEEMLDSDGNFYQMSGDMAFMFPLLEMAGHRAIFIEDMLYVYNLENPNNDHKINNRLQISIEKEIRSKTSYKRITGNRNGI